VLALTAVLFVALGAGFLATIQVLLYIGGVVTLLIFGVMLTHRAEGVAVPRPTRRKLPAAVVSLALFAAMAAAILKAGEPGSVAAEPAPGRELAGILLGKDLLAFEALSLLLLAAMVGAIVVARPKDAPDAGAAP
jgi:NADH-quinone oxidoreductase subunit J